MSDREIKKEKRGITILIILGIVWMIFSIHNSIISSSESDKLNIIIENQEKIISAQLQISTNELAMLKQHEEILSEITKR